MYHPHVDRILQHALHRVEGTWSQGDVPGPRRCTWSWGLYLVPGVGGGVPGPWGVPGPRGCTWSRGVYLVLWGCTCSGGVYLVPSGEPGSVEGGVPGLGVYLDPGGVPGPVGCTWSWGVYLVPGGIWSRGVYLVPWDVSGL